MKDNIFKKEIENKICNINEYSDTQSFSYIICTNSSNFKDIIQFDFDSLSVYFSKKELFLENGLEIQSYKDNPIPNFNGMIMGSNFINLFNYTVFDYDSKQIGFYSNIMKIMINLQF